MPLDSILKKAAGDKIRLILSLDEAQDLFDFIADSVLPKNRRNRILKIYQRLENEGFIHSRTLTKNGGSTVRQETLTKT